MDAAGAELDDAEASGSGAEQASSIHNDVMPKAYQPIGRFAIPICNSPRAPA